MCGIGGILRTDGKRIPAPWLTAIERRIGSRGPDDKGRFRDRVDVHDEQGRRTIEIALVHRRLSIIDHEGGAQPMVSERGRSFDEGLIAVVFNGCIYNHGELRQALESEGHKFVTDHSDTEVLIHGYRQWGQELPGYLEGMYAFAIWDRGGQQLTLGRDWFGQKPLYVRRGIKDNPNITAFASDPRCLAELTISRLPRLSDAAHRRWRESYLQLGYGANETTAYASGLGDGVMAVAPTIREKIDKLMPARQVESTTQNEFEELIEQAVSRQLEADVPLGCFLSGGVDSSLIAFYANQYVDELKTFCLRMPDARYDESVHAEAVAEHLGTKHTTLEVSTSPAEDLLFLVDKLGQPFGDSSILPTYWVSQAARPHVKVALSGDGGDELFIGYERYLAARALNRHRRILRWIPKSFLVGTHPKSKKHKLGRLGQMARDYPALGVLAMESLFTQAQIAELLGERPEEPIEVVPGFDPMQSLRREDLQNYLPADLLTKVDVASMAVGLEVRSPFLDRDLASAALSAPTWQLLDGGQRKGMLRAIARRHLPESVVDRPKAGFSIPIGVWFRTNYGAMRTLMLDHLRSNHPFGPLPIDRNAVKRLIKEHLSNRHDHGQRLFALLTLSIWSKSL